MRPPGAAFLDRDGTINVKADEGEYVESTDELVLLPGAAAAIRRLNDAGLMAIVITNQRGIALGRMSEEDLAAVHSHLEELLAEEAGARLDAIFHCPHDLDSCACRKPDIGLFLQATERWPGIDLGHSAMIGDSEKDVLAGERLGMATVLLGRDAPDLAAAVDALLF
ncbi:MAG TPA: HAD family hydrolase [Solirubrobacterales bacterium]|nr:HAD family hydrolase [Solirubrobacterales bacterium]